MRAQIARAILRDYNAGMDTVRWLVGAGCPTDEPAGPLGCLNGLRAIVTAPVNTAQP